MLLFKSIILLFYPYRPLFYKKVYALIEGIIHRQ